MQIRLLIIGLLVLTAIYLFRRYRGRIAADPRLRYLLSGVGLQLLRVFLLRTALPIFLRGFRFLRFFR